MEFVRRWPYTFISVVAILTVVAAIAASSYTGVGLRDPEGFLGPAYIRLPLLAALMFLAGLIPAAIRRSGWKQIPRGVVEVIKHEWTLRRILYICTGLLAFYICYVGYRNLKSVLPLLTDEVLWDTELAALDLWMFGNVNPAFVFQDMFGTGISAAVLSFVYLIYLPVVPISLGVVLVFSRDLTVGAWYATAMSLNWIVGTVSYYILPAVGPIYYEGTQWAYAALPETNTSALQDALWRNRETFLADPAGADVIHGVAAFASLHCSVTFTMALFAHLVIKNKLLRIVGWAFFGLTFIATLYFGWHYLVDSLAGVLIGWLCVAVGAWATGNWWAKRRTLKSDLTEIDQDDDASSDDSPADHETASTPVRGLAARSAG
ncbi:phosphatase PAP2 family protein [Nesterenkonia ebinurensis]|uniref:phosphatase PAP2 family protein n=1 Tax=Nesterenkonia ebinurensis TaxID=2608252 RepID=UPI00123CE6E7|nr:phosphatase PAP2 family protein [Nesterenkonia ebinurensis]